MKYLFLILMLSVVGCGGGGWTERDGLEWSDVSAEKMSYDDAIDYCEDMGAHLPTIDELRTLIKNCPATETGGACAVTNSCAGDECYSDECKGCDYDHSGKHSVFGDNGWYWSSTTYTGDTNFAWSVYFGYGNVGYANKTNFVSVRCVRGGGD